MHIFKRAPAHTHTHTHPHTHTHKTPLRPRLRNGTLSHLAHSTGQNKPYSNLKVKTHENRLDSKSELPSHMAKIKDTGEENAPVRKTATAKESKCKF